MHFIDSIFFVLLGSYKTELSSGMFLSVPNFFDDLYPYGSLFCSIRKMLGHLISSNSSISPYYSVSFKYENTLLFKSWDAEGRSHGLTERHCLII